MKELRDEIVTWVNERIEDMLAAPRMWGSDEAVELQVLLLLEIRTLALRPEELAANPRCILDAYAAYLTKMYPAKPNRPLSQIVETDHLGLTLAAAMRPFRDQMVKKYAAQRSRGMIAVAPEPKPSHSAKKRAQKNPWQEFDAISQAMSAPPRFRSPVAGGRL